MKWHFIGAAPLDDFTSRRGAGMGRGDGAFANGNGVGDGADAHHGNGFGNGGNSMIGDGWGRAVDTTYVELLTGVEEEA